METAVRLKPEQIQEIAWPILREALATFGLERIAVSEGTDPDGDAVIDVSAIYGAEAREPEPRSSLKAELAVQQAIFKAGDERTIHLLHVLPTDAQSLPQS